MSTHVKVVADKLGNIIGMSQNNPEYGFVRVEQNVMVINHQGWLRNAKRYALIKGKVKDLLDAEFKDGLELPGKIVVHESLRPFNLDNPERDLKIAGETGIICRVDDQPIYRQTFYTTNMNATDELIDHDESCRQEIKEVLAAQREISSLDDVNL